MICSKCGGTNTPDRNFCGDCGAPLAQSCAACGASNAASVKFCGKCGSRLSAAETPVAPRLPIGPSSATPSGSAGEVVELRVVSVLFADLVGFTTHRGVAGPRGSSRDLLSRYFDVCRELVERYGGTVEKFIGDAVMAVWGAPVAQEDDAERAVRAGAGSGGGGRRPRRGGQGARARSPGRGAHRERPRSTSGPGARGWWQATW